MSWFDEQIKLRKKLDDENFEEAIEDIAGAIMGVRLTNALSRSDIADSAISEILRFYHCKYRTDPDEPDIEDISEQLDMRLRPFGIMRRSVVLESGWYKNAIGPMLGTLKEDGSAVALIPGSFSGYQYVDLKTGKKVKLNRETDQLLDRDALCFYKPLPLRPLSVADLVKFMLEQFSASDITVYLALMAAGALLGLLSPLFTRWLFGSVLESGSVRVLLGLAGFMVSFSICRLFFSAYQALMNSRVSIKLDIAVQAAVMSRILSLPAGFFKQFSSGELNQRASYIRSLCTTMMNTVGTVGISSVFSLIYIGQIFAFAPALVLPSITVTLLTAALSVITTFAQMRITKENMLLGAKTSGMTYSMITGIQKIKLAGAEKRMFSRWSRHYAREAALSYNPPMFLKLSGTISLALSLLGPLLLYSVAVKSGISVADYYAFDNAYGMVSGAFMSLASMAVTIANIRPTLEMAKPILEAQPELSEGKEQVRRLNGGIELSHVSFSYEEGMPDVIDDLSLTIRPGEYIAIVGSTGCGKSTLLRLLLGFETPQKGIIAYDGKNINRLDLRSLRRKIGVVMQDGKLFLGDIFSNITISAPQLTLDEAWEAAEIASIAEDIREMPMGMHTLISEGQGGISGGQRQRLMIARAVAPKPRILMFDEATSALDNLTQKKVSEAIDSLKCTRIVIAHRLSTIRRCDRIIVLSGGKIAEEGTYDELIAQNGAFAELIARQRLDIVTEGEK